jgi:hypothetical protein
MVYHLLMVHCNECSQEFEHTRGFKLHLKRFHDLTMKDYVIKHVHDGVLPTCACGCGAGVAWRNDAFFLTLVRGHVTQFMREKQVERRLNKKMLPETKQKLSSSVSEFFLSQRGKQVAQQRAQKLRAWTASESGKISAIRRGMNLKLFNSTDVGKQIRAAAGRKVSEHRKNNHGSVIAMGKKVKAWYASPEGLAWKRKRSLACTESMRRIAPALEMLEFIDDVEERYVGFKRTSIATRCRSCGFESQRSLLSLAAVPRCFACKPFPEVTKQQREVGDFVQSLGYVVDHNDWKTLGDLEIDVLVRSAQFGIEFNGLYWHSETNRSYFKHVDEKHRRAQEIGIRLLTIFEDEWRDKRQIVEAMIGHRLGLSARCHARKLDVRFVNPDERKEFFERSHIDGDVRCTVAFGLFNGSTLLSVMSLRTPFHQQLADRMEVARFAVKPGVSVAGGLSRLTHRSLQWTQERGYVGLLAYVDKRIGSGAGYVAAGYKLTRETGPRFWWTNFHDRFDRFQFRATGGSSQVDVARAAGVVKIWGAGNFVFEFPSHDHMC